MKPLRLEMQAFGPFRGKERVDFAGLSSSLFLIAGPIGAGKTTVLDAICFALYGESSGKGRAAGDLRSHHADATVETEVTLDFSVGGKTYRVNRRPKQEIRKRRGEGTRAVQARGTLWDRTGKEQAPDEGAPLAGNVREVDARIGEILGFDAAQFRQVILLPQGQFREFLSANSKDREGILKVLFDVRRCEELERELKDAVQGLERNRQGREAARREKLGTFASREDLEQGVRARAGEVADLEVRHRELAVRDARVEKALAEGLRVAGLFAELGLADRVRADLADQAEAMDAVRDELTLAEKARPVLPEIAALDTLRGEIAVMERELGLQEGERITLAAASLENGRRLQEHKAGEDRHEGNIAEVRRLEDLRPRVKELERAVREKAAAAGARARLHAAVASAGQALKDEEQRLAAIEGELPALRAAAGDRASLEARLQELKNVELDLASAATVGDELKAWAGKLSRAREAVGGAAADFRQAERYAQEMRSRWIRSRAGALAAQLVAGQPCPVCGSPEHPAPTAPTADGVTEESLQAAEDDRQTAADREKKAGEGESAAAVKVAEFTARADGMRRSLGTHADTEVAEIRRNIGEKTAARAAAVAAAARAAELEAELVVVKDRLKRAVESRDGFSEQHQQAAEAAARAAAAVEHLEGVLPGDLRSGEAIEQRLRLLADEMASWRRTSQVLEDEKTRIATGLASCTSFIGAVRKELQGKCRRGEQAALDLGGRLAAAGFTDDAACRTASRTDRQISALRERLEKYNNTLQQAQGALDEARKKVAGLARPDPAPLERERAAAAAELQACGQELGRLQEQHRALSGRLRELDDLEKDEAAAARRNEALREIAAAAAGDNSTKLRFSTYALAAYFDDVMGHTNRRLALMSSGRYTLARATDTTGGGYKGLDLEVLDAHTDRARPADTLSGGEGFLASMALALGLADAVQSAAGGYKLESVFIDEGFGSLDAESLELAQRCIIDLQQAGRMVGLISHVEEMSSWTPARIEIKKTPRGSVILTGG